MTFIAILESVILGPLTLLFEVIFELSRRITGAPGLSIVLLSLAFNILVLPLYKRADAIQEETRKVEESLREGVAQIKKYYSGDERMMILQTYYNQNNYKPIYALKGSISVLLQIPFFMAAYRFLSTLSVLQGASLGPIADLGAPDKLLVIGGLSINLLPLLMTLINIISGVIYLKGFPLKTKVQTYGLALFFLVFLYNSPAGLVFYWTLNNLFSLCKTLYYKLNVPSAFWRGCIAVVGAAVVVATFVVDAAGSISTVRRAAIVLCFGVLPQMGWGLPLAKKLLNRLPLRRAKAKNTVSVAPNKTLFVAGALFLTALVGLLIPSTYIAASPQEYVDINYFFHPLWYVLNSLCLAAGTFLIWSQIFYGLAKPKIKIFFERAIWVLSGIMVINYMFFGQYSGMVSSTLQYLEGLHFSSEEMQINPLVVLLAAGVLYLVVTRWRKAATNVLFVAALVLGIMSVKNVYDIKTSIDKVTTNPASEMPTFTLSKEGKNVVVIMLDRAMGRFVPYIFNEKPELEEQFDGFTYYSNVVSFGKYTNYGVPSLMGGYEYTPVEMNKDDSRSLVEKHNEALKVMPVLFSENGYEVTVCDPSYANYQWIPDLSIYDEYPEINTYITKGHFNELEQQQYVVTANLRNFFCFSLMKCMPIATQNLLYQGGNYLRAARTNSTNYTNQVLTSTSTAQSVSTDFLDAYNVLRNISEMTQITEGSQNTFLFLQNQITHCPTLLQTPDYVPADVVDNTEYDANRQECLVLEDGSTLDLSASTIITDYHSNMAAFLQLADWMDYLRENDLYDNTRIILVSDHGQRSYQEDSFMTEPGFTHASYDHYFPLLMVKDFNSTGFTVSEEFMTNADVPTLATDDVIENPINPFTNKAINSDEKYAHDQFLICSTNWNVSTNNGMTYLPDKWIAVSGGVEYKEEWEYYGEDVVLQEHAFPE